MPKRSGTAWKPPYVEDVARGNPHAQEQLLAYLKRFGYYQNEREGTLQAIEAGVRNFQQSHRLPETGVFEPTMFELLGRPRCGVPDNGISFGFVLGESRWQHTNLTFAFDNFTADISEQQARREILDALADWSNVTPLTFAELPSTQPADLRFMWASGNHANEPVEKDFDGLGGVLAHAFFPPPSGGTLAGQIHFDEDELWTATGLRNAALHEIGHALGLNHSPDNLSVMSAFVNTLAIKPLTMDDIVGVQSLYGQRPVGPFTSVFDSGGHGMPSFDLMSDFDRAFAFDFDHSGAMDHLVMYRPGQQGLITIVKKQSDGSFTAVYTSDAIGGYKMPSNLNTDQAFAFDYDHSGLLDHICLYRPGQGKFWIIAHDTVDTWRAVYNNDGTGIGGLNFNLVQDRAFAFDFEHIGAQDHLFLFRNGSVGGIRILKNDVGTFRVAYNSNNGFPGSATIYNHVAVPFDFNHSGLMDHVIIYLPGSHTDPSFRKIEIFRNDNGTFKPVLQNPDLADGIAGYKLLSVNIQMLAFDLDGNGKTDYLLIYDPGSGQIIIANHRGNDFVRAYDQGGFAGGGIGKFDLKDPRDRIVAFDYDSKGTLDYLVCLRPGTGDLRILKNERTVV
ncbi:matrix metalloproteinase [Aspergillus fischeri NRRL 181]|uniref:Matrix metalloproteinase n=1 Tax=Neosartorya fischeri (strain ATCC 1020 / DSM 3700 / CBS 544.65 / FGSC A1164 / JCM 1740 / NRRL 181 / WB 181) TaxID=331117 RepID=A1DIM0_NEOFI|nr:matrix metalloproteinase [Aspergillus fischeri NRRL 181]EAW19227.1 matrix metalloproteinase [Aspergillus fischeri NRRL 181]KAG2010947.1 hypothetical protein GB937_007491 [Aspergillus fischeri]